MPTGQCGGAAVLVNTGAGSLTFVFASKVPVWLKLTKTAFSKSSIPHHAVRLAKLRPTDGPWMGGLSPSGV